MSRRSECRTVPAGSGALDEVQSLGLGRGSWIVVVGGALDHEHVTAVLHAASFGFLLVTLTASRNAQDTSNRRTPKCPDLSLTLFM